MLLFLILFFPFVSAKGICPDGNKTITDTEEIKVNNVKNINGIKIVVISAEDISVYNRYMADVFIDGDKGKVTIWTSDEFVLSSGSFNATLINTSPGKARIKIADDEKELELDEFGTINGLDAILIEVTLSNDLNSGSATLLIGANKVSFSNDGNPSDILEVGGKKYLIELFSASDGEAAFTVSKCESGEIQEEVIVQNNTEIDENQTLDINETINNSAEEETSNSSEPQITVEEANRRRRELELGINSSSGNVSSLEGKEGKVAGAGKLIFFIFLGLVVIAIGFVLIKIKMKESYSKKSRSLKRG